MMENVRRRVDIRLCSTEEQARKLIAKSNFNRRTIFSENLMAVHLKKNPNQIFQTNTGENNSTQQQERTTQLGSRNETTQLVSRNETTQLNRRKQLNSSVGTKQLNSALPSTACNRLQPPTTACNRLQPPTTAYNRLHRLYSRIGFFYLLPGVKPF
ncbi:hypothetical protein TNCV_1025211 [Trichonephila clavipes]|nr:hypothetical protein TNCV_1025211 [Trichonephila clavipes]